MKSTYAPHRVDAQIAPLPAVARLSRPKDVSVTLSLCIPEKGQTIIVSQNALPHWPFAESCQNRFVCSVPEKATDCHPRTPFSDPLKTFAAKICDGVGRPAVVRSLSQIVCDQRWPTRTGPIVVAAINGISCSFDREVPTPAQS
jgi:hypothetical protein